MSEIIIQGIQFDEKSSFLKGPAQAPQAIRNVLHNGSANLYAENGVNIEDLMIVDKGDHLIDEYFEIEKLTNIHLNKDALLFTLGGDHSITFPVIKALHKYHDDFDILHIDAHADLYHEFEGDPYSHACPFARIMESDLATRLVQVGIRTLNDHQREQATKFGVEIHEMKNWNLKLLPNFTRPLYISLDMDAFDPAYAPGVSHHEPGGFSARQVLDIIQTIKAPIIGADIVEYNPSRDFNDMTAALAAKMMKEILGKMIENK